MGSKHMAKFQVIFARYGWATVDADSEQDAYQKVEGYGKEDIEWSDDFEATDCDELDEWSD